MISCREQEEEEEECPTEKRDDLLSLSLGLSSFRQRSASHEKKEKGVFLGLNPWYRKLEEKDPRIQTEQAL